MATTATVRSNRKDNQSKPETQAKDSPPKTSRQRKSSAEKFSTFATFSTGCGLLGATFGSGRSTLIGVAVGTILGLVFAKMK